MANSIHEEAALRAQDKTGFSDIMDLESHVRMHIQKFLLFPQQWGNIPNICNLEWKEVKFSDDNKSSIDDDKGVYAFVIKPSGHMLPPSGYIAYVGKATDLQVRYGQYVREKKYKYSNHRYHIAKMLTQWANHISFMFATVNEDIDPRAVESALINGLHPPYNRRDFEGVLGIVAREAFQ